MTPRRLSLAEFRARLVELMAACGQGIQTIDEAAALRPTQVKHRLRRVQNTALRVGIPMIDATKPTDEEGNDESY